MQEVLKVRSWVAIRRGCRISYRVHDAGDIELTCDAALDEFEFTVDADALRELVRVGTAALADVDALEATG
jgi:hypothetical protein